MNGEELEKIPGDSSAGLGWEELLLLPMFMGLVCAVLVLFIDFLLAKFVDLDLTRFTGGGGDRLLVVVWVVTAFAGFIYLYQWEFRSRKRFKRLKARVLASDDLLVELHHVEDCKFVREPEHGHPMYFVRCADNAIIFILEGQDELEEDWGNDPLNIRENEKPRVNLKIIRDPKTNDCILLQFDGQEIPVHECHIINVGPKKWPSSGDVIKSSWEGLKQRYKLEAMDAAAR